MIKKKTMVNKLNPDRALQMVIVGTITSDDKSITRTHKYTELITEEQSMEEAEAKIDALLVEKEAEINA